MRSSAHVRVGNLVLSATCAGVLAARQFKPQAVTLAEARGIRCVDVDLEVLRGEREPELTLFAPV